MTFKVIEFPLPYHIHHYTLESVIGQGGFGRVYKATSSHYAIENHFAVKVLGIRTRGTKNDANSSSQSSDQKNECGDDCGPSFNSNIRSFESEVNALKKLDDPHVIQLFDFFREGNLMFIVLELCPN